MSLCRAAGAEDSVVQFASTSKVTFAGAGLAFFGGSRRNVDWFRARLSVMTIGPDKVNQLRHLKLLPDMDAVRAHMRRHAALLRPSSTACGAVSKRASATSASAGGRTRPAATS